MRIIIIKETTTRFLSCLRSFNSLNHLYISDSSLSFPSFIPQLLSSTVLSAERVTSQCYEGLISSLPGLVKFDITLIIGQSDVLRITKCHLSSEMTARMWSCLRPFTSLNHLTISDSSLSFSLSPPELPSVTMLLANKLTSQCYQGLISSLPGLRDIDVQNAATDDFVEFIESSTRLTSLQRIEIKTLDRWRFDFDTAKGVQITKCHLSSEMTARMWSCLRPLTSLNHLTISDSSLSFSLSPPALPSITKLLANKLTSQCYQGLILSLPGLRDIDVQNAATDDFVEFVGSSTRLTSLQLLKIKTLDRWQFDFDTAKGVQVTKCHLSSEMTARMWLCLRPLTSLNTLTISDSSLSFSLSPPELPSVTKLLTSKLTSQCYQGLISSLPGLRDIDVQDAARDDFVQFVESSTRLTSLHRLKIK
ncbi:uncharacterized protein LOC121417733 [Lytechinus variegatus]|uniref:uncharacterized protein LOC121417733 n=1 Tax=Lytechinus variegatus TaxID=7654 RepID=UPI001BB1D4BC|nr:uncharacterized protein LOC121417733 [Lytechinus variegatus]